ncbi:MAG: hypothetical protein ACRC5C_04560, partial [Bacilli bacterium]
ERIMRKGITLLLSVLIIFIVAYVLEHDVPKQNNAILDSLAGEIYYTERINGVLTLFRSNANLTDRTVVYSHVGRGQTSFGDTNENIITFNYDVATKAIDFVAMHEGEWSLFRLPSSAKAPFFVERTIPKDDVIPTNYIETKLGTKEARIEKGSIMLKEEGVEEEILPFRGLYSYKMTGYDIVGFSPDGKFLVYTSFGHRTPFGTMLEGFTRNQVVEYYILNLETKESAPFVKSNQIQWLQ